MEEALTTVLGALASAAPHGSQDLAERLTRLAAKAAEPATVVVMGEFKRGKSSLVNALAGGEVVDVDPLVATAERRIVDAAGASVWDTPPIEGLESTATAGLLVDLSSATCVVFVSDASQEYSATERDVLRAVDDAGLPIVAVLTKIDLYPAWQTVLELDQGHLDADEIVTTVQPVSDVVFRRATEDGDDALLATSGLPALNKVLWQQVIPRAVESAHRRVAREAVELLDTAADPGSQEKSSAVTIEQRILKAVADDLRSLDAEASEILASSEPRLVWEMFEQWLVGRTIRTLTAAQLELSSADVSSESELGQVIEGLPTQFPVLEPSAADLDGRRDEAIQLVRGFLGRVDELAAEYVPATLARAAALRAADTPIDRDSAAQIDAWKTQLAMIADG